MDSHGDVLFASEALPTEDIVDLRRAARQSPHASRQQVGPYDMFVEHLHAVQRLILFGAGEDARPLTRIAAEMGWHVIVVDSRASAAKPERFLAAEQVIHGVDAAAVGVTPADAIVLMTHSYEQDRKLLAQLLPLAPRYLGLLGARHRSALLLHEAAEMAGMPLAIAVERTRAPIGLEIGGDGPEAVALAIVAELQRTLSSPAQDATPSRRMSVADVERIVVEGPAQLRSVIRASEACALQ
jgi:xanthine/CO dehydrogenase XdhC/CoxF family maturation factor